MIPPKSSLRRVESGEVAFCGIRFESKTQRHHAFDKWASAGSTGGYKLFIRLGIMEAIIRVRSIAIETNPINLEFLISRWIIRTHTSMAS